MVANICSIGIGCRVWRRRSLGILSVLLVVMAVVMAVPVVLVLVLVLAVVVVVGLGGTRWVMGGWSWRRWLGR